MAIYHQQCFPILSSYVEGNTAGGKEDY